MRLRRIFGWGFAGIIIFVALFYLAWSIHFAYTKPLVSVLTCADGKGIPPSWICQQGIYYGRLTPDEIKELNTLSGTYFAVMLEDKKLAEKLLKLFLARGVDIDSVDNRTGLRAFESAVISGDPANVKLLLKYGAKMDFRNDYNETMLELAKRLHKKFLKGDNEPGRAEIIKILEAHEKQGGVQ